VPCTGDADQPLSESFGGLSPETLKQHLGDHLEDCRSD
jgi:hypothetical protein